MDQRQWVDNLFREHAKPLFRYLRTFRLPEEDTYDLVQEAYIRLMSAGPSKIRKPKVWLFTVGRNLAINVMKREKSRWTDAGAVDLLEDESRGALADLMDKEDREQLWAAFSALSDGDREMMGLYLEHEFSYRQIAEVLGRTEISVRVGMHRCRNRLKKQLRPAGGGVAAANAEGV
jgi:RNA polymerase sigma-70 factor (ECF subfamily)